MQAFNTIQINVLAQWIFDNYDLCGIEPLDGYIDKSEEIRMAAKEDLSMILIYLNKI